jgi:radical SAM protein with 4Fe4S-binding SPASM domain
MVILPETYTNVYDMARFLKTLGVKYFSVGTPSVAGELSKKKDLVINKKYFRAVYSQLCEAKKDFDLNTSITGGFPICTLPKVDNVSISMIDNYCDAGLNQLVIDPNGNLRPCVCLDVYLGNILKHNLERIWKKNKFLKDIRELNFLPKECNNCDYVHICRGGCRASALGYYGNLNAIDPLML